MEALALLLVLVVPATALARAGHSHGGGTYSRAHAPKTTKTHSRCYGYTRDKHGHIKRSAHAKSDFRRTHSCPSTGKTRGRCPGYVIDHVTPLARGGADAPGHMQWQTKVAAKAKDKWERR